jgi:hypothetical protein
MSDIVLRIDRTAALVGALSVAVAVPLALYAGEVTFQSGPSVGAQGNAALYDFANGTVADAEQVNNNFNAVATAVNDNDGRIAALEAAGPGGGGGPVMANMVRSNGATNGSGSNFQMLNITLDLTGMEGRWIHVYGGAAIAENSNTSNTSILRLVLDDGTPSTLVAQR